MPTRILHIIPALTLDIYHINLSGMIQHFRGLHDVLLQTLDEHAKNGSRDAALYAYGVRAWPDRKEGLVRTLCDAIENDTCEEANRLRELIGEREVARRRKVRNKKLQDTL